MVTEDVLFAELVGFPNYVQFCRGLYDQRLPKDALFAELSGFIFAKVSFFDSARFAE